jgi:glycosyltransferase involved in cell wall biosynthesis
LLVSSEGLGDFIARRNRIPTACYCHTPLKILHDPVTRSQLRATQPSKARALDVMAGAFNAVDRRMWRRFRHVFANSEETAGRLASARLMPGGPVEVLHPGLDLDRFTVGPEPRADRFLIAGRIMWQKRLENGIAAFIAARERGIHAELVVAGAVDVKSQPYIAELRAQAAGHAVTFEPDPTDARMAELLRTSRALVMTAPNEDFGMIALEAMASGTPVIAANTGGPRESVVDGVTGWLVTPDAEHFADAMVRVAAEPAAVEAMAPACRRRAEAFSWPQFVARVDDVMEALAEGRTAPPAQSSRGASASSS